MRRSLLVPALLLPLLLSACADPAAPPAPPTAAPATAADADADARSTPSTSASTAGGSGTTAEPAADVAHRPEPKPVEDCPDGGIRYSLAGTDAEAGHLVFTIAVTNVGAKACRITEVPRFYLHGETWTDVGRELPPAPAPAMRLVPGGRALVDLRLVDVRTGGGPLGDSCTPFHAVTLVVHSDRHGWHAEIPIDAWGCTETDLVTMDAGPLRRG